MSYQSNENLLNEFEESEKLLREANQSLKDETESGRSARIAEHMRKWEEVIHETLVEFKQDMSEGTENTFTQATPHGSPVARIRENLPAPEDPKALTVWSLKRHEELAEWCETLAQQSISDRSVDLFQTLADQIRDINRQLATDTRSVEQG